MKSSSRRVKRRPSNPSPKGVYVAAKPNGVGITFSKKQNNYFKMRQSKAPLDAMPGNALSIAFKELIQKRPVL